MIRIWYVFVSYIGDVMGIVKINDQLHEDIRKASSVMVRSINAQAEYWIKVGMLAEANPGMTFSDIMREQMKQADVEVRKVVGE
tara:strand:- start:1730 stop:1981 length:252 start_codon:yes stop_codon:yes gene_type:complete